LAAFSSKKFDIHSKLVSEDIRDLNYGRQTLSDKSYEEDIIPLSISNTQRQIVEFRVDYNAIPEELEIYLEDKLSQQFYNLKENSAQIVVDKGINSQGRFFLHTKPAEFWIEDNSEDDTPDDNVFDLADGIATKAFDFFNLKDNILHFEGVNSKEQVRVNVFNLNGYKVFDSTTDLESSNNTIQLPYTLSEGVYIVELYRASGKKITKKIIIR
jgi:methionine-rich copper-binding protein CopC